ncbi:hypothetical protein BGW80DRAFT_892039 [Lactifluus volemus]|nr:hypothetical protein BGW80DRAFT_892039 [Lactifluus volemus]
MRACHVPSPTIIKCFLYCPSCAGNLYCITASSNPGPASRISSSLATLNYCPSDFAGYYHPSYATFAIGLFKF